MKTLKTNSKMKNGVAILPLIIALFFMASCNKEETIKPSHDFAIQQDAAMRQTTDQNQVIPISNQAPVFAMIQIVHKSHVGVGKFDLPDYSVIVQNNGTVTYVGRSNVKRTGTVTFQISGIELINLKNLFVNAKFNTMEDNLEFIPNYPLTLTTFKFPFFLPNGRTLVDFGQGYPEQLIQLRTSVENMLHISQYVKGTNIASIIGKSDL
jgi:hypothetical protein